MTAGPQLLAIDLGTSVVKAAVWGEDGIRGVGRATLTTTHPRPGWDEQDPARWWPALLGATARALAEAGGPSVDLDAVVCSGARQTVVVADGTGKALGPAIVWSDQRAGGEAAALVAVLGGTEDVRQATGVVLDGRSVAAKVAWLAAHDSERLASARWLLTPRDQVVHRLSGEAVTDWTMASASGLYDRSGHVVPEIAGPAVSRLPAPVPSAAIVGGLLDHAASELGLSPGIPVVVGAGDRACEVLGSGASASAPMVSWGTTANVSVPVATCPAVVPNGLITTRGARQGWLLEAGLAAAGSALEWWAHLTGRSVGALAESALASPPGARGVVATPWLGGARAPWWQPEARGSVVGLSSGHDVGDVARAIVEGVAFDVRRCLSVLARAGTGGGETLALAGGSHLEAWTHIVTAVTGRAGSRRRSGDAALAGAALLGFEALGHPVTLDQLDPMVQLVQPEPVAARAYVELARRLDATAAVLVDLPPSGAHEVHEAGGGR